MKVGDLVKTDLHIWGRRSCGIILEIRTIHDAFMSAPSVSTEVIEARVLWGLNGYETRENTKYLQLLSEAK